MTTDFVRYEYRIQIDGEHQHFIRLNDANDAADKAYAAGTETRIEYRQVEPEITEWVPLAWEDTLPGRLGYPRFAGYGGKVGGYTCGRCGSAPSTGVCCSSHGRQLCHACYRRTHFVEVCVEGCAKCAAEGLPVLLGGAL